MWYIGIANVTTNSVEVIGDANVDFVNNVEPGDAFISTGNGLTLEVLRAESRNKLVLARPYTGPTGSFAFSVQPTQDFNRVTANAIIDLRNSYGAYRDTILQGMFPDGSGASPGMRFIADPDTGFRRYGPNVMSAVCGGVDAALFGPGGTSFYSNGGRIGEAVEAGFGLDIGKGLHWTGNVNETLIPSDGIAGWVWKTDGRILIQYINGTAKMVLDATGNLIVGAASAANHVIARGTSEGDLIMQVQGKAHPGVAFFSAASGSANGSACAFALNKNSATGRSANAAGTINGSGADYAEYEAKADGCGTIAAGDVCGVDRDGLLTDRWADAILFRLKSTNPSIVGGDTWAAHLGPRPEAPGAKPVAPGVPGPAPSAPVEPGPEPTEEGPAYVAWLQARFTYAVQLAEYETALVSWQAASIAYPAARAQFEADHAAWVAATAAYDRDLPIYEAALEAERQKVDRIAYCGKVPVNMTGPVEAGDYLIAVQDGERIKAVAVKEADMTLALYMKRLGRVLFIRDGRPWADVQHG